MENKPETIQEEKIKIKGMRCKSCVDSIESGLEKLDGVEKAKVGFVKEECVVRFDSQKVNIEAIKKKIEEIGYSVGSIVGDQKTDSENSKDTVKIKIEKPEFLTILVGIALILSLLNAYNINILKREINSSADGALSGSEIVETGEGELREVSLQPSQQQDTASPWESQPPRIAEVDTGNYPILGLADVPVTIVEFSCFECPFCARFNRETLPLLKENYIETGKVKWAFRDFPLSFHPNAQKAHEAARCANEQGKFWEYHQKLFDSQAVLGVNVLKQYARELGLNTAEFELCLDSGRMAQKVQEDFISGSEYGVNGTPTFFINGIGVAGALPYQAFEQVIEQELNQ